MKSKPTLSGASRKGGSKKKPNRKKKAFVFTGSVSLVAVLALGLLYATAAAIFPGLSVWQMYQNVASPYIRYVNIAEGLRKEEVAQRFATTLGWSDEQKQKLINIHTLSRGAAEGFYFPATYEISANAKPEDVSKEIIKTFDEQVGDKSPNSKDNVVDMDVAIKIASIIQREAAGKHDMKLISGIIWNRLFKGMTLDMDATLQYAKGDESKWWPKVKSEDKNIDSPYNTYKNKGLPPSAISNPGADAINAALNPTRTRALFYIHDRYRQIHTAETYEQHVANIQAYL